MPDANGHVQIKIRGPVYTPEQKVAMRAAEDRINKARNDAQDAAMEAHGALRWSRTQDPAKVEAAAEAYRVALAGLVAAGVNPCAFLDNPLNPLPAAHQLAWLTRAVSAPAATKGKR